MNMARMDITKITVTLADNEMTKVAFGLTGIMGTTHVEEDKSGTWLVGEVTEAGWKFKVQLNPQEDFMDKVFIAEFGPKGSERGGDRILREILDSCEQARGQYYGVNLFEVVDFVQKNLSHLISVEADY